MPGGITVLVADDHPVYRRGIIDYLKTTRIADNFLEAANGHQVIQLSEEFKINFFLLDVEMPGPNGYETAKLLMAKDPEARIIINTMHDGLALVKNLLRVGVKGFVLKGEDTERLEEAFHSVRDGKTYISPKLKLTLPGETEELPGMEFTPIELELVKLLSKGYPSSEIAKELEISIRTAETYRHRLIKRLKVANAVELVEFFHKNGLM
ncbi:MAG: response regulator transcription factor [Cyclobacteriaceae bacterium]|nr:response regulator transcription factor [Cyclobacteriaceae bacterium]